jgi:DNA-binding MarR family transcriptional regulator
MNASKASGTLDGIDKVIHERARLGVMSLLAASGELTFVELKRHLEMTDGNLSVHLRILEEAGYVAIEKSFVDRKPRTVVKVTKKGRAAFKAYIDALEQIIHKIRG